MTAPNRGGHPRTPVRCVETGQVFPSIAAAAAWAFVDRRRIREALQNGSAAGGYHWAAPGAAAPAEPAPAPAEGDVAELARELETVADLFDQGSPEERVLERAAALLRQTGYQWNPLRHNRSSPVVHPLRPDCD